MTDLYEDSAFKLRLFSAILDDLEEVIANSWTEYSPSIPESEVAVYPEEFRIWFIDNKWGDLISEIDEGGPSEHHVIAYRFKSSVSESDMRSIKLEKSADEWPYLNDYDDYSLHNGRVHMVRELDLSAEMIWHSAGDQLQVFYDQLISQHCEDYDIPIEWIEAVQIID